MEDACHPTTWDWEFQWWNCQRRWWDTIKHKANHGYLANGLGAILANGSFADGVHKNFTPVHSTNEATKCGIFMDDVKEGQCRFYPNIRANEKKEEEEEEEKKIIRRIKFSITPLLRPRLRLTWRMPSFRGVWHYKTRGPVATRNAD